MKAQEVELALEEVEKAGEEQAKFGKCLGKNYYGVLIVNCIYLLSHRELTLIYSIKCV